MNYFFHDVLFAFEGPNETETPEFFLKEIFNTEYRNGELI